MTVSIVIPIYKPLSLLSEFEAASLRQVLKVCPTRQLVLVCPDDLDVSAYLTIHQFETKRFAKENFESVKTYNKLCQNADFYRAFDTDYILLYQLDAWIFEDKIDYFVEKGFDYIGSPHQDYIHQGLVVGNGGFSLRKCAAFINVCEQTDFTQCRQTWEDIVFTNDCADMLSIADLDTAYECGWQQLPARHMSRLGKLPMATHSPNKYSDWAFWSNYINIHEYDN